MFKGIENKRLMWHRKLRNWYAHPNKLRRKLLSLPNFFKRNQPTLYHDQYLDNKDWKFAQAHGLTVVGEIEVPVKELHIQYRSELKLDPFLVGLDGELDRSIVYSPFYKLLEIYIDKGHSYIERNFRETDYYKLFRYMNQVELIDWRTGQKNEFKRSDTQILEKIQKFIRVYESIKQQGYLGPSFDRRYIIVLEIPFEVQCLGQKIDWEWHPYEIWSGHHRAAALAMLGHDEAKVVLLKPNDSNI